MLFLLYINIKIGKNICWTSDKPVITCMGNSCLPGCRWLCLWWRLFVLSFFPRDVLGEIWDLNESVSEGFATYSLTRFRGDIHFEGILKQCRPSSDATERGVWPGSASFAYQTSMQKQQKWKYLSEAPNTRNGLIQIFRMDTPTGQKSFSYLRPLNSSTL